jgi:hypothetical protein
MCGMSVDVTLLPATIPHRLRDEDIPRTRRFPDEGTGEGAATFGYSIHASGALVIWRTEPNAWKVVTVFGPSAWENVEGDQFRSL